MGSVANAIQNPLGGMSGPNVPDIWSQIGGDSSHAGLLGTGQFTANPYQANAAAFAPNADEQAYIRQLQGYANGTAPSAAQTQMQLGLQQANAQAQALAASQRGISPALAARYAAQSQASNSQNIAGQSAVLRAQEQQQAMGMLGDELRSVRTGQMGLENLNSGNQNFATGANLQGYTSAAANRGNMMSHIGNAMTAGFAGAKGGMATPHGFVRPTGYAEGGMVDPSDMNTTQVPAAAPPGGGSSGGGSGGMGGIMKMLPMLAMLNRGGMVNGPQSETGRFLARAMSDGGMVDPGSFNHTPQLPTISGPATWSMPSTGNSGGAKSTAKASDKPGPPGQGDAATSTFGAGGGTMATPPAFAFGGMANRPEMYRSGGQVGGKAEVRGDSLKNDKVPTMLSPGEIVIPRSITMGKNPSEKAKAFVEKVLASHKEKKNGSK